MEASCVWSRSCRRAGGLPDNYRCDGALGNDQSEEARGGFVAGGRGGGWGGAAGSGWARGGGGGGALHDGVVLDGERRAADPLECEHQSCAAHRWQGDV